MIGAQVRSGTARRRALRSLPALVITAALLAAAATVVMRKTVNGGRTWLAVAAPDAPPADMYQGSPPANAVGAILFSSAGEGWAFGPALWQTRDGGATWRNMSVPGGPVQDLGMAGDRGLAVTGRAGGGRWACRRRG